MSRRVVAVVVVLAVVASVFAVATVMAARAGAAKGGDFDRCLKTCNTVVKYYSTKRPALKAHEGDKQCWQTCDKRFNKNLKTSNEMKSFWQSKRDTNLHANQCAQACWRNFHKGADVVSVAGYRSKPRTTACTAESER